MNARVSLAIVAVCALVGGCSNDGGSESGGNGGSQVPEIGKVLNVVSSFPQPPYKVEALKPAGIDPKILGSVQQMPPGLTFEPAECETYANGQVLPPDIQGNMAAVTAEAEGNRFIAIALETSEEVKPDLSMLDKCRHVTFTVDPLHGFVDVIDSPQFEGAETLATHRVIEVTVRDEVKTGEIYTYVAYFGRNIVLVTGNQTAEPGKPVVPVNVERTRQLFTDAVAAVRS